MGDLVKEALEGARDYRKASNPFLQWTKEDMEEIEISSRLYQEDGAVFMTALVLSKTDTEDREPAVAGGGR